MAAASDDAAQRPSSSTGRTNRYNSTEGDADIEPEVKKIEKEGIMAGITMPQNITIAKPPEAHTVAPFPEPPMMHEANRPDGGRRSEDLEDGRKRPQRKPPSNAILSPEFRYCPRDGLVKPYRCHHCRICGTVSRMLHAVRDRRAHAHTSLSAPPKCVLMYDHHCPCKCSLLIDPRRPLARSLTRENWRASQGSANALAPAITLYVFWGAICRVFANSRMNTVFLQHAVLGLDLLHVHDHQRYLLHVREAG